MKNERKFLKCDICGNIVGMVENAGVPLICCGKEMHEMAPNTVDAAQEKHIPVAVFDGDNVQVKIGSVVHPQTPEHHITWIAVAQGPLMQRMALDVNGTPDATFCLPNDDTSTAYAYCNLHGLWAADIKRELVFDEEVCSAEFSDGCK